MQKLFLGFVLLLLTALPAVAQDAVAEKSDSVQENIGADLHISLLTCGGYDEVWALYGHSALRVQSDQTGEDFAVNYGLFDFNQPNFIARFLFGKCDYLMGFVPFKIFMQEFTGKNAYVIQHEINLTPEEKVAVMKALYINSLPENAMYRYNFFYDNCATRPRDMILNNIPERIIYNNVIDSTQTFRQIIHANNGEKPWCRFGNDMLLGIGSDQQTTRDNQQFLPAYLMRDFKQAEFVDSMGNKRPVVLSETILLPDNTEYTKEFPLSPLGCSLIIFGLLMLLTAFEMAKKKRLWLVDAVVLTICGIVGLILFLMLFSEHPTVKCNLLILMFNPLLVFFSWRLIQELRGRKKSLLCRIYFGCLIIAFLSMGLSDFGIFIQYPPEGFLPIVLALMVRVSKALKLKKGK